METTSRVDLKIMDFTFTTRSFIFGRGGAGVIQNASFMIHYFRIVFFEISYLYVELANGGRMGYLEIMIGFE